MIRLKFTKWELESESVSEWVTDKHSQWSDLGPIKILQMGQIKKKKKKTKNVKNMKILRKRSEIEKEKNKWSENFCKCSVRNALQRQFCGLYYSWKASFIQDMEFIATPKRQKRNKTKRQNHRKQHYKPTNST